MIKMTLIPGKKISSKRHMFSFANNFLELISDAQTRPVLRNELGRLPLKGLIEINVIKFWLHLENVPDDNIAKQSLQIAKELSVKNLFSFTQTVQKIQDKHLKPK